MYIVSLCCGIGQHGEHRQGKAPSSDCNGVVNWTSVKHRLGVIFHTIYNQYLRHSASTGDSELLYQMLENKRLIIQLMMQPPLGYGSVSVL